MPYLLFPLAFSAVAVLMPLVLRLCAPLGATDIPDGVRKLHAAPTPRLGGLLVFSVVFSLAPLIGGLSDGRVSALLTGGVVLLAVGVADDVQPMHAPVKLLLQVAAATAALLWVPLPQGIRLLGRTVSLAPSVSLVLCLLVTVSMINAANLIDGVDGLAGGVFSVGLLALAVWLGGTDTVGWVLCLLLVCALAAFLLYNRAPAIVFLGDSGSQTLGLTAAILLLTPQGGVWHTAVLWLFAVPLFDLVLSTVRRLRRGQSLFRADRGHIHHRLLRRGFSPTAVAGLLSLMTLFLSLIGLGLGGA